MRVLNLTPHPLMFYKEGEVVLVMPPDGPAVRVEESRVYDKKVFIDGHAITVLKKTLGEVKNLPEKQDDTYLIVSKVVADVAPDRDDLLYPDVVVRDDDGLIIGCQVLARNGRE